MFSRLHEGKGTSTAFPWRGGGHGEGIRDSITSPSAFVSISAVFRGETSTGYRALSQNP